MRLDISANFEINKQKTISSEEVLKQVIKRLGLQIGYYGPFTKGITNYIVLQIKQCSKKPSRCPPRPLLRRK